ncbi:MAG: hypothetical protein JWO70_4505 [Betaproteobacteria bacterium]|nr:hypothetical protein [Betaproteobacteria bacterium]
MNRIFIIFSAADAESVWPVACDRDLIVGDLAGSCKEGGLHFPELSTSEQRRLTEAVAAKLSSRKNDLLSLLPGFANAYYECTTMPLARYIAALNSAIAVMRERGGAFEVVFPRKLLLQRRTSAYYMSEYELQGVRLYSREAVFLPYLVEVCGQKNATHRFSGVTGLSPVLWFELSRVWLVFAVRFFAALAGLRPASQRVQRGPGAPVQSETDVVVVSRSPAQSEVISPFLRSTGLRASMVAAESFFTRGANWKACMQVAAAAPGTVHAVRLRRPSLRRLVGVYLKAASLILTKKKETLEVVGVAVDITQSIRELLVMLPDLVVYAEALEAEVSAMPQPAWRVLLTFEQKSPHGLADALTARKLGLKCVHVMQCDQFAHVLPFPVFGDWFLTDSRTNQARFAEVWGADASRVAYVGSFKACVDSVDNTAAVAVADRPRVWCFFANYDVHLNRRVLAALREIAVAKHLDVLIKLHPRDSRECYRQFSDMRIVAEGDLSKTELFASFTHAITFPSGVVLDLLFSAKPYLLLNFGGVTASEKFIYGDADYAGLVGNLDGLERALDEPAWLEREFAVFRQELMKNNDIVHDAGEIKNNLMALLGIAGRAAKRDDSSARTIDHAA